MTDIIKSLGKVDSPTSKNRSRAGLEFLNPIQNGLKKIKNLTKSRRTRAELHQSTAASTWWCGPRPRLGWVEVAVGLPEGPSYPGHSPSFFRYAVL